MPLLLLHASYTRTCTICGDRWEVTRRQAKGSPGRASRPRASGGGRANMLGGPGRSYDFDVSRLAFEGAVERWQAYRRCPTCGIDSFAQAPTKRTAG